MDTVKRGILFGVGFALGSLAVSMVGQVVLMLAATLITR